MHPDSAALDISSKPYVAASQRHVLETWLAAQPAGGQFTLEKSPLFGETPDWWFRRVEENPRPFMTVELTDGEPDPRTDPPDTLHATISLPRTSALGSLTEFAASAEERGALVCLMASGTEPDSEAWSWEAQGLFELHPDTAMVAGRAHFNGHIVAAGDYFGFGGTCGCPDVGRAIGDPGYFAQMWKQRSVSAGCSILAVVDPTLIRIVVDLFGDQPSSLSFIGAWCGLAAARTGRRVVYSPFVSGKVSWSRDAWDSAVSVAELRAFRRCAGDLIPETGFFSPCLSLDPHTPYLPATSAERAAVLGART
jgi:hypothetical protein